MARRTVRCVWIVAVAVIAVAVAENGILCMANEIAKNDDSTINKDNGQDKVGLSWTDWAKNKFSGKWSDDGDTGGHSFDGNPGGASDSPYRSTTDAHHVAAFMPDIGSGIGSGGGADAFKSTVSADRDGLGHD